MRYRYLFLIGTISILVIGAGVFIYSQKPVQPVVCDKDSKICPNGTVVGRSGPLCEFQACSSEEGVLVKIDEEVQNNGVFIKPLEVVEDSRCPLDVQCIWAGTTKVRVNLRDGWRKEETVITLGSPVEFAGNSVELLNVFPSPYSKSFIPKAEYSFHFLVKKTSGFGN